MRYLLPSQLSILLVLGALSACADDPTQIIVEIDADGDVIAQASVVRLQVFGRGATEEFPPNAIFDDNQPVFSDQWPLRHVVAPSGDDATRIYRIAARAFQGTRFVAETRVDSGFVTGETRVLRLRIAGGDCAGVQCTSTTSCTQGGICGPVPFIPPNELPREGETRDAGVDGAADGGDGGGCEAGTSCDPGRPLGACEVAETVCTEGVRECAVRLRAAAEASVCRAAAGACDASEICNGTSPDCPDDGFAPTGTSCGVDLYCVEGSCGACTAGVLCNTGNACEKGIVNCDEGVPRCDVAGPADPGTVCRPAVGLCDAPELCDGTTSNCPSTDALQAAGFPCRPATGACDVQETCSGSSAVCPADQFEAVGVACRAAEGLCDTAVLCDGTSACPADTGPKAMGTICRAATDECDEAELCDGNTRACGDDIKAPAGTQCEESKSCDGAGSCVDLNCGDPCDTGRLCEQGQIVCGDDGITTCEPVRLLGNTTVCRPKNGVCDLEERCTGTSPDCPANTFAGAAVACRGAQGVCDAPEVCTGSGPDCPADVFFGTTRVCRTVPPGDLCGREERCTGLSVECPADVHLSQGTVCRAVTLAPDMTSCDVAEVCLGNSPTCPADQNRPSGFLCRAASGLCDVAESCSGTSPNCPVNQFKVGGSLCRAVEGICDVTDLCTGTGPTCPQGFLPPTVSCRPPVVGGDATTCDSGEFCTGMHKDCPPDQVLASGTRCRASLSSCDQEERCDGARSSCPADDAPITGASCTLPMSQECLDGRCTSSKACIPAGPLPAGTPCAIGVCNGTGLCIPQAGDGGVPDGGPGGS